MEYRVTCVPVCPVRKDPAHRSEMISQLLFGEKCILMESVDGWEKVQAKYDGYEGWVQSGQVTVIDEHKFNKKDNLLTEGLVNEIDFNGYNMMIPIGCSLSAFNSGLTPWNKNSVKYKGEFWDIENVKFSGKAIRQFSFRFLNTSYLWGGKSVYGIDCSGFVQTVYKFFGKYIPRDSSQQAEEGETIDFLQSAKCGDLAFFDNEDGKIVHVGMLLNSDEIIHSSTKVRIDKIDNHGIVNRDTNKRTHHLRIIKRFFLE